MKSIGFAISKSKIGANLGIGVCLIIFHQLFGAVAKLFFGRKVDSALLDALLNVGGQRLKIGVGVDVLAKMAIHKNHLTIVIRARPRSYAGERCFYNGAKI